MTSIPERQSIVSLIQQANQDGARLDKACAEAGICLRTYRRWYRDGAVQDDKRPTAVRPAPANKLTATEQGRIIELCNSPAYSQLPPSQIVPDLLDKGVYLASESTFYRVLKEAGQLHHRGRSLAPRLSPAPTTHKASGPCEVWCWDITYCPSIVGGQFYYLYMFEDLYSRKIVGYEVRRFSR